MAAGEHRIVFLGPPGSGKGTQAARLAEALGVPAVSTGDMFRAAVAAGSELGRRVQAILDSGQLVSDELTAQIVRARLDEEDAGSGFILDGYPRTAGQAGTLAEILGDRKAYLDQVVSLVVPEEELMRRLLARGRTDDTAETVRQRLEVYQEQTAPLIEFYRSEGLLREIDGHQGIDQVQQEILKTVDAA